jgi:hypothetical protein
VVEESSGSVVEEKRCGANRSTPQGHRGGEQTSGAQVKTAER